MSADILRFYVANARVEDSYSLRKMLTWRGQSAQETKRFRAAIRQELQYRKGA